MRLDHFMYAMPSLAAGMDYFESLLGVRPVFGGAHEGGGTCNALVSLGDCYLEIIAPDPKQNLSGTLGEKLAALESGGLATWAAEADLKKAKEAFVALEIECFGPFPVRRRQPDGPELEWEILFPQSGYIGIPFFIDWMECVNPSETAPHAGQVREFTISSPESDQIDLIFRNLGLSITVKSGMPNQRLVIDSPNGVVELESTEQSSSVITN